MLYFSRYIKELIRGVPAAMKLKALKNEELLESLKQCVLDERNSTVDLVCHLAELDQRKYVEELGYASLFSYCSEKLGISESATYKRITAARVLVRFPQVEGFLRNNQLNLSTLLEISSLLKPENADELFERVLGKTKREVERIALEYRSPAENKPKSSQSSASRYIPAEIESAVRKRDGHCCSYVGPTGRRCGSTWQIELHHLRPFSLGGKHSVENLALRCRTHNMLEAQEVFGREKIDQFVRLC